MKQLWKRLMILLICFVFVFVAWIVSDDIMDTLSANTKAASIYNIGDTVVFGKESFTYIGDDGSNLLLLGETSIGDNKTWNDANTIANNYRNSFGNIGKTVSVSSLAGTSDLLLAGTTGIDSSGVTVMDALDASIPSLNGNWWLKDSDLSSKNLARFLSGNNRRDGYQSYQKYTNPIGMTCQSPTSTRTESGTAFTQAFNEGGGVIASYPKTGTMTMTMDIKSVPKALGKYTTSNCASGTLLDSSPGISVGTISRTASFSRNSSNKLTIEGAPVHIFPFAMSSNLVGLDFKDWSSNIVTIGAGQCINLCSSSNSSGVILNPKIDGTKICGLKTAKDADLVVKLDIWSLNITAYNTISCPAVSTPAMTMSTRPLMKLPLDKILTYHNAKPTYSLSTSIDGSFPVSDTSGTRPYLTMMSDAMNVSLDSTNNGVKGTILSLKYPTSGTLIDLPLSFSGAKEGNRYIAASAVDKDGNEVYSVLDMVTADKQSISIDYQNLLKDGENSFQLTLYVLDDGIGDTSYRSTGTTITVRLKDEQTIDFDSIKNKATVEYGSDLELYANLTSDLNKQSTSDLVFSIPTDSRGKYQIIQQSYDRSTGVAKVKIRPLTANVNAKITISKSGDLFFFDAEEKTMNLNFTKRDLYVHPTIIEGKTVGDMMPKLTSESDGLVFADTIPDTLIPYLERLSPLIAERPDVDGIIQNPGTWKLLYDDSVLNNLGDFTNKYNVILEDYRDDERYVFEVDPNGIPDAWIEMTPDPNNNGWNNTDVKVKPSNEAIYFGYHSITDGNQDPINELIYTNEDKGFLPKVSLVGDDGSSNRKTLRKVRIDKTNPTINIEVPSGWYAGTMNVGLTISDNLSGIESFTMTKGGADITCNITGANTYECPITSNGVYTITATDMAGNTTTINQTISNIDDTKPTISAVLGTLHSDKLKQDIDVTRTVGVSGATSLKVLYKGDGESNFTLLENLNPYKAAFTYEAQMNGEYRFELTTGSNEAVYADVTVTQIEQNAPVVKIETKLANDPTKSYVDSTWTNDDVIVTISNANKNFTDPITFQYKKATDTEWIDVTEDAGTQVTISTTTWMKEDYVFRAYVSDTVMSFPHTYGFWIDKEKPVTPEIENAEDYVDSNAFYTDVRIEGNLIPKNSGIKQTMYYQLNDGVWTSLGNDTFLDITTMGRYEIRFKSIDEAGNESEPSDLYIVNYGNKKRQEIAFDMGPETITYGNTITIKAILDQPIDEQADTNIIFSVSDTNKATIISQGYDKTTGEASALIKAMNGDRYVDILINKAGDSKYLDASQVSYTLNLEKVAIEIKPQIITGTMVNDAMPTIGSQCDGLIEGDQIPTSVKPTLTAMSGSAVHPDADNDGIIENAGTWSMHYANDVLNAEKAFADKYDVTFIGYDAALHPEYVFEVGTNGIPDSYLIITPNPNTQGWNNTDVIIELSNDAKAKGYTSIALIESNVETKQGSQILLDQETAGMYPTVVLKSDSETSDRKTLREVKIDKTKPTATVQIENDMIWTHTDKKVSIEPSDTLSGIQTITVEDPSGTAVTLNQKGNTYEFSATTSGIYQLTIRDNADNQTIIPINVERIDKTLPTITATSKGLNTDSSIHEIDVTYSVGTSGAKALEVYYKKNAGDTYTLIGTLDQPKTSQIYEAKQNGYYKFVIENNVNEKAEAEIEINDIVTTVEKPIIQLEAKKEDGANYASGTWVNQNVTIRLKNTNTAVSDPITYQYREKGTGTWIDMDDDHITIKESDWQNKEYEFRGTTANAEGNETSIRICIDKEKPEEPDIKNKEQFISGIQHASPLTITGTMIPKASAIQQEIRYSLDHGITWQTMGNSGLTLTDSKTYEILFKTVDEAGNESDETKLYEIDLNDGTPSITIKLNQDPIKQLINSLTFGFFYKQTIDVDIEVEWYGKETGDVYYILDDDPKAKIPQDSDPRWTSGNHTSIDPDRKTMIYAKAVNKDGKTDITSSMYHVVADATPPTITFGKAYDTWTNDDTLQVSLKDSLSGIKEETIEVKIDHKDKITTSLASDVLTLSKLPEGSYQIQVSVRDQSGNETKEQTEVKIDKTAPEIIGVKDKSVYHHYYLPRYIEVKDALSGVKSAEIQKDGKTEPITNEIKINSIGTYVIQTSDNANNERKITFVLVPLPDIETEIDGSDESKEIIDQIKEEYEETKDRLDETEKDDILQWIDDATDKWNGLRVKVVYNEDKTAKIEAMGDETFPPKMVLVVEEIDKKTLPTLPREALEAYDVYLKLGDKIIQPTQTVKVYLPYENTQNETYLYEVNEKNKVKEIDNKQENGYLIFETKTLEKYAISDETQKSNINIDTDKDGKPDINIDVDCDGEADLNIDTNGDNKPDIDIDTTGDGKPNYNIDIDNDGIADINIGPVEWKPNKCQTTSCGSEYCTSTYYKPYLNIDTDDDGRPDVNLDIDKDKLPELNIDVDGDFIPDVNIDTTGDGKADINIDTDNDGKAELNLVRLTKWKPEKNAETNGFAYDTMEGIEPKYNIDSDGDGKADKNLVKEGEYNYLSGSDKLMNQSVNTSDDHNWMRWWILFIISFVSFIFCMYQVTHKKVKAS